MRLFRTEVWSYAILLIILFAIAAIAVWHTISYLEHSYIDHKLEPDEYRVSITLVIGSITLGLMLIAGAFGLWAIQFSAEAESRRRIGRLIDAMYYLNDGLLAIDKRGRITGSNPAAKDMTKTQLTHQEAIRDVFPCLTEVDLNLLLSETGPNEVERELQRDNTPQVLRFRAQPSDGIMLILVSDVTSMNTQRARHRQAARLLLIGQIARGVAHDFNRLLCGISGHASLLSRVRPGSGEMRASSEAIIQETERGISLAGHLLELAQTGTTGHSTDIAAQHVKIATEMLRDSLSANWNVESIMQDEIPPVGLTGIQVEQVVLNLGLLATDTATKPGVLQVVTGKPGNTPLFNVDSRFAGVILVTSSSLTAASAEGQAVVNDGPGGPGVILSVVQSMIEEAGGTLDCLTSAEGASIYRIALPRGSIARRNEEATDMPGELKAYISNWSLLLASAGGDYEQLEESLRELGTTIETVDNVMSALARVEADSDLDAILIDKYLLGQEAKGLLRAIIKLRPKTGIVVLCEDPESESEGLSSDIMFVPSRSDPNKIMTAMIDARSLATHRQNKSG